MSITSGNKSDIGPWRSIVIVRHACRRWCGVSHIGWCWREGTVLFAINVLFCILSDVSRMFAARSSDLVMTRIDWCLREMSHACYILASSGWGSAVLHMENKLYQAVR